MINTARDLVVPLRPGTPAVRKPRAKPTPESIAKLTERAKRQAVTLSRDFAAELDALTAAAEALASIESAHPGVREIARSMAVETKARAAGIRRLLGR